ncbi:MAG: hypothetical protein J1E41_05060 [Ruminococcus sp.]|nr:hypothetical protein [Ruminococcus sp.]
MILAVPIYKNKANTGSRIRIIAKILVIILFLELIQEYIIEKTKLVNANDPLTLKKILPSGIKKSTSAINTILSITKSKQETIGKRKLKTKSTLLTSLK